MFRTPRYRRSGGYKGLWLVALLAAAGLLYANWPLWQGFTPQDLVENSELKAKNFELPVQEITSPRAGLKAYLLEDKSNPIISLNFSFKNAGYAGDNEHQQGMSQLAAALLGEGAGGFDAQGLKEELETRAIKIDFASGKDDFSGSMLTTKANAAKAAELLKLILTEPRFDDADIRRVKAQMQEALKRQSEHPQKILELAFAKELYGQHPYGRNPLGQADDIAKITAADLQAFVKDNFTRGNLLIGVAGDVGSVEAGQMLDNIFAVLPTNGRMNFVRPAELDFDGRSKQIKRAGSQNMLLQALPGVGRNDEDFYPLFVANYVWGGAGLTSRLSQQIREKEGLTYGIYSYLSLDDKSPLLMAGFAATPDKFARAKELLAAETEEFRADGMNAEELKKAKDYLIASYNLRFASIENIAEILTAMQKYDLGLDFLQKRNDYIANLNLQQVNRAAEKYFDKNHQVSVELGSL